MRLLSAPVHRAAAGRRCHLSKIFRPQVNATRRATVNGKGDCDEAEPRQSGQPRAPAAKLRIELLANETRGALR